MTAYIRKDLKSKNENNVCYLAQDYLLNFPLFEDYIQKRVYHGGLSLLTSWKTIPFCAIYDGQNVYLK